jgi:hypothetical protein
MNNKLNNSSKILTGLVVAIGLFTTTAFSQSGSVSNDYPELAGLYNAFDVTQAQLLDAIAEINSDPSTMQARMDLRMELDMVANMSMQEMMAAGMGHGEMGDMTMTGPYGELEVDARMAINDIVRGSHSAADAASAFENSAALTTHAARVLAYGREFENKVWDIFADTSTSIYEKRQNVTAAIEAYQTGDAQHAVTVTPKSAALYLDTEYSNGLKAGFPRLGALLWTNQWLQLASLEAIIIGQVDPQFAGNVGLTVERYWNKVGSDTGMTMFPVPNEMPSAPAISPQLYSQAPDAAVIIDNLNMLEAAIADIIAYPVVEDRESAINNAVAQFTAQEDYVTDTMDYLLSALRGGIFNQGGPAIGELDRSERNRSRSAMNMQHTMIMSAPQ